MNTTRATSNLTKLAANVFPISNGIQLNSHHQLLVRSFAKLTAPGPDPLQVLRETCLKKSLCDESGFRVPGVHWVFAVAVNSSNQNEAPNLRTIGIQRVSDAGIDFCIKKGCESSKSFAAGNAVSVMYSQGRYVPGEQAEQWRAEGFAEKIPLEYVLEKIPHYTITGMVASKRITKELSKGSEVCVVCGML